MVSSEITLDHGEGGQATARFIQEEILTRFGNPILNALEDGAWIPWDGTHVVVSTDSFIVDPPVFPGGDIGKLAIAGTVNDLLAAGAAPHSVTLSLILSQGLPLSLVRRVLDSARQVADSAGVQIVAGDTKVLPHKAGGGIYINTTGVGSPIRPGRDYAVSQARPGDCIITTGTMGDHGFAVLSYREGLGFESRVMSDCAALHEFVVPLLAAHDGIHCVRDPSRGGLVGVLVDIAEASEIDIEIEQSTVPIQKEVRLGCEMLGLDPLVLPNEGKMVVVVDPDQAGQILAFLRRHALSAQAEIIGTVREAKFSVGQLCMLNEGHRKVVLRPEGVPIPRLC